MIICSEFKGLEKAKGYYSVKADYGEIRIFFISDDIIRIRASFDKNFRERSYLLTTTAWEDENDDFLADERTRVTPVAPEVIETEESVSFSTQRLTLILDKKPLAFRLVNTDGEELYSDLPGRAFSQDKKGRIYHYKRHNQADYYYGFGEKSGEINKRDRYMRFSPKDSMGYNPITGDPLYKHIPMYIRLGAETGSAVGVFYHNTYQSAMSMGEEISGYWPHYTFFSADGGDIDFFLLNGPSIKEVVANYTKLTGRTAMQPKYTLGHIGSTMYYVELPSDCDKGIISYVDKAKEEDIPLDGFMLSSGYTSDENNKRNVFTWNRERFSSPEEFFTAMRERGVEVVPNVKPGILNVHPKYKDYENAGCFIKTPDESKTQPAKWWGGPGAYFDFTSQKGREVWVSELKKQVVDMGTVSIWNDNCEYDGIIEEDALYNDNGRKAYHEELKPIQANIMSMLTHTAVKSQGENRRPYVISRSGAAGIQRYAQVWSGDNYTSYDSLKYNIATLLGLGLSGVANCGSDIGGFAGPAPDAELFVRWVQHGVFQPRFSIHSASSDNSVTEPWMYSGHTKYIRDAIKLRYSFIPYFYSLLWEAHKEGTPIMRPMFMEFQQDPKCYNEGVNFMLGRDLLVATVIEPGQTVREVYLPKGCNWYDFYTRERYEGGTTLKIPVDLASIPLFVRGGAIIPMTEGINSINKEKTTLLKLLITPDIKSSTIIYDDDGVSCDYKNGAYLEIKVDVTPGERLLIDITKTGNYKNTIKTTILDVVNRDKSPFWVEIDGKKLTHYLHRDKWAQNEEGWYYSHTTKSVLVKYSEPKKDYQAVISCEKFDIIGM